MTYLYYFFTWTGALVWLVTLYCLLVHTVRWVKERRED